jgi:hypothetical protein
MQDRSKSPEGREVRETQIEPTAGVWYCDNCGRRIQVITESDEPKVQPFVCVCGATMQPGGEYSHLEPEESSTVDD